MVEIKRVKGKFQLSDQYIPQKQKKQVEWRCVSEDKPICYSTGDWDGKQSDLVLAQTFEGKSFIAQCYEGFMDGSHFFDWYFVDSVSKNDYYIDGTIIDRWMELPN